MLGLLKALRADDRPRQLRDLLYPALRWAMRVSNER
jgi:hypothetical protein